MKRILMSLAVIASVSTMAVGATSASLSDGVTSNGNTFAAGTLVLKVDGSHDNVVKFNLSNMKPGSQVVKTWKLKNEGTLAGRLNLKDIIKTNSGGVLTPAEVTAGDAANAGNLGSLLGVTLFNDLNGDGWVQAGETRYYDGTLDGLADHYDTAIQMNAGASANVTLQVNWWNHAGDLDNAGQGDSTTLDILFRLDQV